ncbi:MAG: phosphoadenylyl-sulfate reductase [Chloroflexi bacterium]|nr:phosphoadenylyl-sulfate reductase [Chloroflexota bacterium]
MDLMSADKLRELSDSFESKSPSEVLGWALKEFHPQIALACSFGAEDVALVDMIYKISPDARIFYLDTDFHFPETYETRDRLIAKYGINFQPFKAAITLEEQDAEHGSELYLRDPDLCCKIRKVEPLTRALSGLQAWITGIRRDQAPTRANAGIVEWDQKFNLVKVSPLAGWTSSQVWDYIGENQVPYNVLHDNGYPSIGCQPCTKVVKSGEDPRAGRWSGFQKTECGLHQ